MSEPIIFLVEGEPRAKQSFKVSRNGGGYTKKQTKDWQDSVGWAAKIAMQGRDVLTGPVALRMVFVLGNYRRVDCDNLAKGTMDGLRGIVFTDDSQVVNLHIVKHVKPDAKPGAYIEAQSGEILSFIGGIPCNQI